VCRSEGDRANLIVIELTYFKSNPNTNRMELNETKFGISINVVIYSILEKELLDRAIFQCYYRDKFLR
jgi:hypothetical protein